VVHLWSCACGTSGAAAAEETTSSKGLMVLGVYVLSLLAAALRESRGRPTTNHKSPDCDASEVASKSSRDEPG